MKKMFLIIGLFAIGGSQVNCSDAGKSSSGSCCINSGNRHHIGFTIYESLKKQFSPSVESLKGFQAILQNPNGQGVPVYGVFVEKIEGNKSVFQPVVAFKGGCKEVELAVGMLNEWLRIEAMLKIKEEERQNR